MKNVKSLIALLLAVFCILSLASCSNTEEAITEAPAADTTAAAENDTAESGASEETGLWADAAYTEDKEFGVGEKTLVCEVKAEDKTVTFTVKTDKKTVGEALIEHGLIEGDKGPYGLYIKKVNGILADYDINQRYWAFYIDGEMAMSGVDGTDITEGVTYQLVYSK
ncbi:MAG: DUF4430 domain-containing protein [Clostridia bacterium]|nr:DUF4430 domain-containing protein [Clostridia bacterium]